MIDLSALLADLRAEGAELDAVVGDRPAADWSTPTPAAGWTVAHQIAHLAWTDERALLAATDPDAFAAELGRITDPTGFVDRGAAEGAALPPADLLRRWRTSRDRLAAALDSATGKLPWYGPPMSPASMATARIMETWAHAGDVADALGVVRVPTNRLRHVAHLGVRTRDFAYLVRGLPAPAEEFRIELSGPDGLWTWGPPEAAQQVRGPALDFCRLVTQRVHRANTTLTATGPDADTWLDIAQAFAGPPGAGRSEA
ncbi:TIGR03084 family metal-binding protein [Actinokineospora diospyrosa]|uniref:TIGR03084 family metal-binding protein n=1 Tax=Actinokineospora diospyrosa TaxID=103728 RepID=UPI0020A3C958|nr:TIGR03084 family metal-binding protein [Actinokineospora diospyrosa]